MGYEHKLSDVKQAYHDGLKLAAKENKLLESFCDRISKCVEVDEDGKVTYKTGVLNDPEQRTNDKEITAADFLLSVKVMYDAINGLSEDRRKPDLVTEIATQLDIMSPDIFAKYYATREQKEAIQTIKDYFEGLGHQARDIEQKEIWPLEEQLEQLKQKKINLSGTELEECIQKERKLEEKLDIANSILSEIKNAETSLDGKSKGIRIANLILGNNGELGERMDKIRLREFPRVAIGEDKKKEIRQRLYGAVKDLSKSNDLLKPYFEKLQSATTLNTYGVSDGAEYSTEKEGLNNILNGCINFLNDTGHLNSNVNMRKDIEEYLNYTCVSIANAFPDVAISSDKAKFDLVRDYSEVEKKILQDNRQYLVKVNKLESELKDAGFFRKRDIRAELDKFNGVIADLKKSADDKLKEFKDKLHDMEKSKQRIGDRVQ